MDQIQNCHHVGKLVYKEHFKIIPNSLKEQNKNLNDRYGRDNTQPTYTTWPKVSGHHTNVIAEDVIPKPSALTAATLLGRLSIRLVQCFI